MDELFRQAFEWLLGGVVALVAWIVRGIKTDVRALERESGDCKVNLANFKTEVARDYAKEATMQQSLGRIHDRIDDVANDIKTLLTKVK